MEQIPESEAKGEIAALYADIRQVCDLPAVNLIYRHLATVDGALAWSWPVLRPVLANGEIERAAGALLGDFVLPDLPRNSRPDWPPADPETAAIVDFYIRGNALNIIAMSFLGLALDRGRWVALRNAQSGLGRLPANVPKVRPLKATDDPRAQALIAELDRLVDADPVPPSLFRHLAYWPEFLRAARDLLAPLAQRGLIETWRGQMLAAARQYAAGVQAEGGVPLPPVNGAEIAAAIRPFTERAIPLLLPICLLLRREAF